VTIFGQYECCGASNANHGDHYAWCRNSPEKRAAAAADWRTHNDQVFSELRARFEVGAREYGDRSWSADPAKLRAEIEAELLDVMNWASIALYRLRNTPAQPVDEQAAPVAAEVAVPAVRPQAVSPEFIEALRQAGAREDFVRAVEADADEQAAGRSLPIPSIGDLGEAISLAVIGTMDPKAVAIQCTDEQAAETIERLRVDVRRLEKSLAQEKRDHERTRRAAEGRLP
jgi:hypothetical protein